MFSILTTHYRAIFCLFVIASGHAWKQHHYYTQTWPDCLLYICTIPSTYMSRPVKKYRLVTLSDQEESVRGISEPCGVFNMEIGFEPHLHRSAHLWAKLCYCWQGKWTINSSLCGLIIILLTPHKFKLSKFLHPLKSLNSLTAKAQYFLFSLSLSFFFPPNGSQMEAPPTKQFQSK